MEKEVVLYQLIFNGINSTIHKIYHFEPRAIYLLKSFDHQYFAEFDNAKLALMQELSRIQNLAIKALSEANILTEENL